MKTISINQTALTRAEAKVRREAHRQGFAAKKSRRDDFLQDQNGLEVDAEDIVNVRRHWNDHRILAVPVSELRDFHMRSSSGGVGARSPRPLLHARMLCTCIPNGSDFPHSCEHGPPPHDILVCITQVDNADVYKRLRASAS